MFERALMGRVRDHLDQFPCVALLGLRQVGKSTLAETLADHLGDAADLVNLRDAAHRQKLADPSAYLARQAGRLVIIDEVQAVPAILDELRGQVELRARQGFLTSQFLLLGSDCVALRQAAAERLGGHLITLELAPLQPQEIPEPGPDEPEDRLAVAAVSAVEEPDPRRHEANIWIRGGMPRSYLAASEEASFAWRRAFMDASIDRGFSLDGVPLPAEACVRAWSVIGFNHGHDIPLQELAEALGSTHDGAHRFVQHCCDTRYLRKFQQWHRNDKKRSRSRPKTYLRDSGLLHALLNLQDYEAVCAHDVAGRSWEGHVLEAVIAALAPDVHYGYFKSHDDRAELDIVVARGDRVWAIEVKKSGRPTMTDEFYRALEELKPERAIVIYRGSERYTLHDFVELMSLRDAVREVSTF